MASDPKRLAQVITCHAWNGDKTQVALCPNNNEIHIYKKEGANWTRTHKLAEHDQTVTSIDWAANTNRIVSCSQDRNAYVWSVQGNTWKPTLVILRLNRAATHVRWSPQENKFAVASGAKLVSVCYFEEDNDWWVSKHIKKHRSTVTSIDWHPNNILLATSSTDFKARVVSAFIKGVDKRPDSTPFGTKLPFGSLQAEYESNGWVQNVRWSPSGNRLAFVARDATITFVDAPDNVQVIRQSGLPDHTLIFVSEDAVIAGGHDCNPNLYNNSGGTWSYAGKCDAAQKKAAAAGGSRSAFNKFKNLTETGQETSVQKLNTKHQNCITDMQPFASGGGRVTSVSTTGLDGAFVFWDIAKLPVKAN